MKQFDFLVLGSGIAGLSFALKMALRGRVAIVTKKNRAESNTNYAQGVSPQSQARKIHSSCTCATT
jgi:L-aspartate oxidase